MSGIGGRHIVELAKITQYLLNPNHPTGKAKATFVAAFGFDRHEPNELAAALDEHARIRSVVRITESDFGIKREIRCNIATPDGRDPCIVSIWLQTAESAGHRFITAYPAPLAK